MANATMKRYLSLDALRGITVAFMCIVNNPGSWDFLLLFMIEIMSCLLHIGARRIRLFSFYILTAYLQFL